MREGKNELKDRTIHYLLAVKIIEGNHVKSITHFDWDAPLPHGRGSVQCWLGECYVIILILVLSSDTLAPL